MPFPVIYDACVLYPAPLRDLLVRLGLSGLCQAKWTRQILDECFGAIERQRPDLRPEQLARSRQRLESAILDARVEGHQALIHGIHGLPDADDRHVVAAAIRCGAQVIVTFNLKDFPASVLDRYEVEAQHPDDFVHNLIGLSEATVVQILRKQAAILRDPPKTPTDVLNRLHDNGLPVSAARLRRLLGL